MKEILDVKKHSPEQKDIGLEIVINILKALSYIFPPVRRLLAELALAMIDSLTGLLNKRGLQLEFTRGIRLLLRKMPEIKVCTLFIDLDGFKQLNDTLGHRMGDKALKRVSFWLQRETRDTDFRARVGGDEYIVVLVDADLEKGSTIAQAILEDISKDDELQYAGGEHISVSIGVAHHVLTWQSDIGQKYEKMYRESDFAMYRAKEGGKNTIRVFSSVHIAS